MADEPYNPLDKRRLGESVATALLKRPVISLPTAPFVGAGIYALYYTGSFPAYKKIAEKNKNGRWNVPIYVGKAVPPGARKGGYGLDETPSEVLYRRLREHAETIQQAENLALEDFKCRCLIVDDIWIPLGESLLISMFSPLWNRVLDGFGNHDPGAGRYNQQRSPWDVVHPGRSWAARLKPNSRSSEEFLRDISEFLK
ncbi:Eco29kI family restriction endonuclease [candidate division KSB1 bacterium]|nr:Eco29kI family restriction endonuclease [candidate division KSB1 bacterium]